MALVWGQFLLACVGGERKKEEERKRENERGREGGREEEQEREGGRGRERERDRGRGELPLPFFWSLWPLLCQYLYMFTFLCMHKSLAQADFHRVQCRKSLWLTMELDWSHKGL